MTRLHRIILAFFFTASTALAWNNTGHKIVALVAWEDLTPATRVMVTDLLKQHPRYKEDLLLDLPQGTSGEDRDRFAFATAATWPDAVRSFNNPMHNEFNHPNWHYVDLPYTIGDQPAKQPAAAAAGPQNAIDAFKVCAAELKDPAAAPKDKAIALCWVLHLCGDIHQPLHAVQMFSPQYPNGDQGGNAELVLRTPPYPDSRTKLHTLWDSLLGQFETNEACRAVAIGLRADPHFSREKLKDQLAVTDFSAWAMESHDLAVQYAYLNGELKAASAGPDNAAPAQIPGLPNGYVRQAEQIAMQRGVLAGYRAADLLNQMGSGK